MNERRSEKERLAMLMMAALDRELSGAEQSELEQLLQKYPQDRIEFENMRQIKEVTQAMQFKSPSDHVWDRYWLSVYNRLERGLAWILFSIGAVILLVYGGFQAVEGIIDDPNITGIVKAGIICLMAGLAFLLVSVIRERFFLRKSDPYKEIKQ